MQDIPQETHHETTRLTQSAQVVLWEIDLTEVGGERYFFCNEQNEKGEPVTWQGRQYQAYPIQGTGFELNGKGSAARPTLTVSNLHGMVTGMAGAKSGGVFQVVLGAALIAVAWWNPVGWLGAAAVSGMYAAGAGMILGGVAQMLAPKARTPTAASTDNGKQNTYFSSLDNMVAQGNVLPVLYGEMRVGSRVVSQEISTADEGDGGQVVVIGR